MPKRKCSSSSKSSSKTMTPCTLDVPYISQCEDNWCWAACTAMVLRGHKVSAATPADVASKQFGVHCDEAAHLNVCDVSLNDNEITGLWHKYDIPACYTQGSVPEEILIQELCDKGHPIEIGFPLRSGPHVAVVFGWKEFLGKRMFNLHDPSNSVTTLVCSSHLSSTGGRKWDATWTNLARPGMPRDCNNVMLLAKEAKSSAKQSVQRYLPGVDEEPLNKNDKEVINGKAPELFSMLFTASNKNLTTVELGISLPIWTLNVDNSRPEDVLDTLSSKIVHGGYWHHQILIDGYIKAYAESHRDESGLHRLCEVSAPMIPASTLADRIENAIADLHNKGVDSRSAKLLTFFPDYIHTLWIASSEHIYVLDAPSKVIPPDSNKLFNRDDFLHILQKS